MSTFHDHVMTLAPLGTCYSSTPDHLQPLIICECKRGSTRVQAHFPTWFLRRHFGELFHRVQALIDGGRIREGVRHPLAQEAATCSSDAVIQQPQQRATLCAVFLIPQHLQLPA